MNLKLVQVLHHFTGLLSTDENPNNLMNLNYKLNRFNNDKIIKVIRII